MLRADLAAAHDRYLGTRTFASLNGVRGLCILAVLWHHAGGGLHAQLFERGFLGVDMFFVLSGFLIVTLLLRERDRTGGISLKNFYARRTLRIFPIYYLVLFILLFFYLTKPGSPQAQGYSRHLAVSADLHLELGARSGGQYRNHVVSGHGGAILPGLADDREIAAARWGSALVLGVVLAVNQLINFGVLDGFFYTLYGRRPTCPSSMQRSPRSLLALSSPTFCTHPDPTSSSIV